MLHYVMLHNFDITLFDVSLFAPLFHYVCSFHLMLYYFNVRKFDNALIAVALVSVTLVILERCNVAVFQNCSDWC